MNVQLNADDLILAAHYSGVIYSVKKMQLDYRLIKNNRISDQHDFAIHYTGMLGEVAVSKTLFIPVSTDLFRGGDGNVDMSYSGQTIQVKTNTSTATIKHLIFNRLEDFSTDWAILCSVPKPSVVKIHGFISKKEFQSKYEEMDFGFGFRYALPETKLIGFNRFSEAINHAKLS